MSNCFSRPAPPGTPPGTVIPGAPLPGEFLPPSNAPLPPGTPPPNTCPAGSTPGSPAGGTTTPCPCASATVTSSTVSAALANRARMRIGVGEEVKMTYSLGAATWNAPQGRFVPPSGATVSFFAPARGGTVTITAVGGGCSATITFTIVEPSSVVQERIAGSGIQHTQGKPDIGIHAKPYLMPDDVCFYNVQWRELEVYAVDTGVFANFPNTLATKGHGPNPNPIGCNDVVMAGKGTETPATDHLYSGYPAVLPPYAPGSRIHNIPWEFSVIPAAMGGGPSPMKQFAIVTQTCTVEADGNTLTISKGGATATSHVNDPTSAI